MKERIRISTQYRVLRVLLHACHRPAVRLGLRRDPRGRFRDPQFVSFMAHSNRTKLAPDLHDLVLRSRKLTRTLLKFGLAGGAAWVALESARALAVF